MVAAGIDHVVDVKVPQAWALQFAGQTIQLEQRNKAMNAYIAGLIDKFRKDNVYAILVKGQGIARCYKNIPAGLIEVLSKDYVQWIEKCDKRGIIFSGSWIKVNDSRL